jgi:hypothetical protein
MDYPFIAKSTTDPNGDKGGLGYKTREEAQAHADAMNSLISTYPMNWSEAHWKGVPGQWEVIEK